MGVVDFNTGPADYIANLQAYRAQCSRANLEDYILVNQWRYRETPKAKKEAWLGAQQAMHAAKLDLAINQAYYARFKPGEGRDRIMALAKAYENAKAKAQAVSLE